MDGSLNNNNENDNKGEHLKECNEEEEVKEMAPGSTPIHRSSSRPQLDVSGAAIQGNFEERNPTILLPNQSDDISHLALDIGGLLFYLLSNGFAVLFNFSEGH